MKTRYQILAWAPAVFLAGIGIASCSSDQLPLSNDGSVGAGGVSGSPQGNGAGGSEPELPTVRCERVLLGDFVPEAARFAPGSTVSFRAQLTTEGSQPCQTTLDLEITHVGEVMHNQAHAIPLSPGTEQTAVLYWQPPDRDFIGYMARLTVEGTTEERSTGIDVSSNPLAFPRYGYISVFPPDQPTANSQQIVSVLAEQYHINLFQMYDWFWRHEDLLPREADGTISESWVDLFGRANSLNTLRDLIGAIHAENGLALGYITMYAGREGYEQLSGVSPAWGLFQQPEAETQEALSFGGDRYLFLFDPSNPAWQARMASESIEAINELGLDGVHIDQFGQRPTLYRADGTPVELQDTFVPFLEAVDSALTSNDSSRAACVFNLVDGQVNGYAVEAVAQTSACDVLYSEIWFTTDTYEELHAYIEQLRRIGRQRAVVLALYPQYGEDVGVALQPEDAELVGVAVDTDHAGYTGSGFIDEFDSVGDSITWSVDFEQEPTITFVFRYANATGQVATRTVLLNGQPIGKVQFGSRGSWDEWAFDAWIQRQVGPGPQLLTLEYAADDVGAVNIDRLTLGSFSEASVRLQNSVVFASGATPIQVGDDVQSLSHEYFPNRSKTLRRSLRAVLRSQFSFITAHETLLFAPDVAPIPERLERVRAVSAGHTLIAEGSGGIWTTLRRTPAGDVIHLVNLTGIDNNLWRDPATDPIVQDHITLQYEVEDSSRVSEVLWATPDHGPGTFTALEFTRNDGYIQFQVPRLAYWDVVLVRTTQ